MGLRLSRLRVSVPGDSVSSGAITIPPTQTRTLVSLTNDYPTGTVVRVIVLGATQHPASVYAYEADGKAISVPFPLGTLIHPLYCCRDLGACLDFQDTFSISVTNGDKKPHRYAALVISEPTLSPQR